MTLKLPFVPAAKECYSQLKQCNKVYRDGFEEMRNLAGGSDPFADRLKRVYGVLERTGAEGSAQPSSHTWSEEDVFMCCVFDLTRALFDSEKNAVLNGKLAVEEKRERLQDLVKLLENLQIGGPKWNQIIMPEIKTKLEEAARNLGG